MKRSPLVSVALVFVFFSWSCSSHVTKDENGDKITIEIESDTDELQADLKEGMEDLQDGLQEGLLEMSNSISKAVEKFTTDENGNKVVAADFRDLKALLPERLLRMDRSSFSGERTGIKNLKIAVAEAEYEDDDRYLKIALIDGAGLPIASLANANWSIIEVDKENKDGFERTTTINGHKAFEKYNNRRQEGELILFYNNRFVISLKGEGIEEGDLRKALDKLDLDELDDL